jgi:hypothetical protein
MKPMNRVLVFFLSFSNAQWRFILTLLFFFCVLIAAICFHTIQLQKESRYWHTQFIHERIHVNETHY